MKRVLSLILAVTMCVSLAACAGKEAGTTTTDTNTTDTSTTDTSSTETTETAPEAADEFSGDVTLNVMLMPQGDMNSDTVTKVTDAVNARIAELGHQFKVEFSWSGAAWAWDNLNTALQTGSAPDIIPAHSWSGTVNYLVGAQTGQYVRLDDPENNLLEKYGSAIYNGAAQMTIDAATVNGDQGLGIYGYIIEKDSVSQLGYLVNQTALEELGFTLADFKADDLASWEPLLKAYADANPGKYPLNIEGEVLDRTVNHIQFVNNVLGPLGVVFDNANPGSGEPAISSRYESPTYASFLDTIHGYYEAGYVDPDQGVIGDVSSTSIVNRRTAGDFLISTFVYAPGYENVVTASATEAQGKDVKIAWVPGWSTPLATIESAQGAGLAVYSGTKYAPEAVTFLNMIVSDEKIGNLLSEGYEGESFEIRDGIAWRLADRAGWNVWRYGVVGVTSAATPLGDVNAEGQEWTNFKTFNSNANLLSFGLFSAANVDTENSACIAVIDKYSVPLGSGAMDPADYEAFMTELKAAGVDKVVDEARLQYEEFKSYQ